MELMVVPISYLVLVTSIFICKMLRYLRIILSFKAILTMHVSFKFSHISRFYPSLLTHTHTQTGKIVGKFKCSTRVMYLAVCGQLLYVAQHSGTLVVIDLEVRVPDLSVFHL